MKSGPDNKASGITLRRLLVVLISTLLVLLLLGSLTSNLYNMRQYMQQQLQSHAQDAATSLGLSLSTVVDARDLVAAGSMIDAIYDSGYYRSIVLRNLKGEAVITRQSDLHLEGVPGWFVDLIDLSTPKGVAEVTNGWSQLGSLVVISHPGFAYRDLWSLLKIQLAWFVVISLLGYLVLQGVLTMILQPLMRIEQQADAIRQRDFSARSPLPRTRELQRVGYAMNSMAERLEQIYSEQLALIESLREQTYRDPVTGLSNRADFDKRLRADLESQQAAAAGSLLLLQLSHFADYNQRLGRADGDQLLRDVAAELHKDADKVVGALVSRHSGADFALYLPAVFEEAADAFADQLLKRLGALPSIKEIIRNDILHIGIATNHTKTSVETLLAEADMALRKAQAVGPNGWHHFVEEGRELAPDERVRQAHEWQDVLRRVLSERKVDLFFQPVFSLDRRHILHHQVLSRIHVDGQLVVAGNFLPMAERFGLLREFDRLAVERLLERMGSGQDGQVRFCMNLSPSSIAADDFIAWLFETLAQHPLQARRLVLELPEYSLRHAPRHVEQLAQRSRDLGYEVAIDRFGAAAVPFNYLQRMPIHFIKIDHSFIRDIQSSRDNQFFLRTVLQIARSQDIKVVAVGVEFEEEWKVIEQLALDAAMGYYLCRPQESPVHIE